MPAATPAPGVPGTDSARISDTAHALRFMLAGNAHVTFVSTKTGTRFTYRVRQGEPRPGDTKPAPHFVAVLTSGSDGYEYLGCIFGGKMYSHGKKSRIGYEAPSARAFAWVWKHLSGGTAPEGCEIHHEGRCGHCNRRLTVPSSLATGLGPECEKKS